MISLLDKRLCDCRRYRYVILS